MRTAIQAATLLLSLAVAATADDQQAGLATPVEFRLKDGRVVVGEIAAFSGGVYAVRTGAEVVRVAERDIRTIAPAASAAIPDAPTSPTPEAWIEPEDRSPEAASALSDGQSALEAGQADVARPLLERAKQLDPWSLPARLALSRACEACGDADSAERELRQVLVVDPGNARALSALNGLFDRTGQRSKGDLLIVEMLRARCPEPEAEYRSARHFLTSGDLNRACAHWNRYLTLRPSPPPSWDVEARLAAEAEALAASGQGARAIERYYDLMQYNPLERENALARILDAQDGVVAELLAARELVRACEALDAMATMAPSRASSFHARSAAACSQELSRLMAEGDALRLEGFLGWIAQRYAASDAGDLVAQAIDAAPGEVSTRSLSTVHGFLSDHTGPAWASTRERLIQALVARADGTTAEAVTAAETLESLDPDRADEWRGKRADAARAAGMAALAEGDAVTALAHLCTAQGLLPEDAEIASAVEQAELEAIRQRLAGSSEVAERESLLQAFVERTSSEVNAAWGRQEIEGLRSMSKVDVLPSARVKEPYFPMEPGTRWTYAWTDGREDRMRVESVERQGGKTRIEISVASSGGEDSDSRTLALYASAQEVWQERDRKKDVWFRFPVASGRNWESAMGRLTLRRTYLATSETVDTRMGTFRNCLKLLYESIDGTGRTMASEMYYAPDVGLVKMTTPGGSGMEIVEFEAGAGATPSPGPGGEEGE